MVVAYITLLVGLVTLVHFSCLLPAAILGVLLLGLAFRHELLRLLRPIRLRIEDSSLRDRPVG